MEMITVKPVKAVKPTFSRQPDEQAKFNYLIHLLVRVKGKTGRPSGEIVSALLTRGKDEINWNRAKCL
jgi:hypothetical protein